jgi:sugar phosphate permease
LLWALGITVAVSIIFLKQWEAGETFVQLALLLACFIGPFLIGWLSSALAADGRGPTYGLYGSLGSIIVLVFVALPTGLLGLMLIVASISGGLNGGLFSLRGRFGEKS